MIDLQTARKESLSIWKYIKDHPEVKSKDDLPAHYNKYMDSYTNNCPLCQYFVLKCCRGCPLDRMKGKNESYPCQDYDDWLNAKTDRKRKSIATIIYNKILNMEII